MKLRGRDTGIKKTIRLNKDGVFSRDLLDVASLEEQWKNTMSTAEAYISQPDSINGETMQGIVDYFSNEGTSVISSMHDVNQLTVELRDQLLHLLDQFDAETMRRVEKIVDIPVIKNLNNIVTENGILRYAANSVVLVKFLDILNTRIKQATEILEKSYENDLIDAKVLRSLGDIGLITIDDGEAAESKKTTSFVNNTGKNKNVKLSGSGSAGTKEERDRLKGKGFNRTMNTGTTYGGSSSGRTGGLFNMDKKYKKNSLWK